MIQLESKEHDYIRILKSQYYKQMSSYCRKEHVGFTGLFCFHVVKNLMPILALLPISSSL